MSTSETDMGGTVNERIALTGVTLIDGTGIDPVENAVITIDDGTIATAGPASDAPLNPEARVIDASGMTVMPGVIDGHCHMGGNSFLDEVNWVLEPDRYQAIASVEQAGRMVRHG